MSTHAAKPQAATDRRPPPDSIVIVGHATIDEIAFGLREPAEVLGGAAVYAACGAAQAGGQVSLVTITGPDYDFAPLLRSVADRTNGTVDVSAGQTAPEATIRNQCQYRGPEDRQWSVLDWDAMVRMSPRWDAVARVTPPAASLVVCPTPAPIAQAIADWAAQRIGTVVVDTEVHYLDAPDAPSQLLGSARHGAILMPSQVHLRYLFGAGAEGQDDGGPRTVAECCASAGIELLVVKRGASGSVLIDVPMRRLTSVPAVRRPSIVDPTGAGDVFDGAFAVTLARTGDPVEAACWGAMAASFAVEHQGATVPSHFGQPEAMARLRDIRRGVSRRDIP